MSTFYAVAKGRKTGVFSTWKECQDQVAGFSGPVFRKFGTRADAEAFIKSHHHGSTSSTSSAGHSVDIKRELHSLKSAVNSMKERLKAFVTSQEAAAEDVERKIDALLEAQHSADGQPPAKRPRGASSEAVVTDSNGFRVDPEGFVIVFTDGACENNGKKGAKAGCGVWWAEGHSFNRAEAASRPTNNCGEIEACTLAITLARTAGHKKLKIHTDSMFTINCATQWMSSWKRKGWKTAKNEAVKNREELELLDAALSDPDLEVRWEHVKGHAGILGNERADELARQGAEKFI